MTVIVNPFDAGGFTLAEMSAAIQMLPNPYGRVGQLIGDSAVDRAHLLDQLAHVLRAGTGSCSCTASSSTA